jgi:hypothetical protein
MSQDREDHGIVVDDSGVIGRWAEWHGRRRGRLVGALVTGGQRPAMFAENEVVVDRRERRLIDELVALGGEPLPVTPLVRAPEGVRPRDVGDAFPRPVRIRFRRVPRIDGAGAALEAHLRRRPNPHTGRAEPPTASSRAALDLAGLVARFASDGRRIALNLFGQTTALPHLDTEINEKDKDTWWAFTGTSRIMDAWQLVESRRVFGGVEPVVWMAILDGGFWLDGAGVPMIAPGHSASDLGPGVAQINLFDENAPAGGTNPVSCSGDAQCDWHGNQVASAAVAAVSNGVTVGAGGTVARPILFRSECSITHTIRCLEYCTAWSLDVVNMSFEIDAPDLWFDWAGWDEAFQFAVNHGVIPVVGAGNDGSEMPDHDRRPATRTPGTITVGALLPDGNARPKSNYGSSVQIWAPGTVEVMPDGGRLTGGPTDGTSIAAPLVSGVAAMLRAINPMLNHDAVRGLLMQTAWTGTGRVTKGLDAYAAVLAAMGHRIDDLHEPNNNKATAAPLSTIGPNTLGPTFAGQAARSGLGDDDWWKFTLTGYTELTIVASWYPRLGGCVVELHPDQPESPVPADIEQTWARGTTTLRVVAPPDTYRIRVAGNRPSLYELKVVTKPAPIGPDQFESNDSFEQAAELLFKAPPPGTYFRRAWGPGGFRPTLHETKHFITGAVRLDVDYFRFVVPRHSVFFIPTIRIWDADQPITVELFAEDHTLLNTWPASRAPIVFVPPGETTCFLRVSGATQTRYRLSIMPEVDEDAIPGPHQRPFETFPPWWLDDPLRLRDEVTHYYVEIGRDPALGRQIAFQGAAESLAIELVDTQGAVVRQAAPGRNGRPEIDLQGLDEGGYLVRVTQRPATIGETATRGPVLLRLAPPL